MRVAAFDLSLTSTGWARNDGRSGVLKPPASVGKGLDRLAWIRDEIFRHVFTAHLVVLEGYSYGQARGSSQLHKTGELGGVVRLALFEAGIPFVDVAPAQVKKLATGKGNAKKNAVLAAAIRRLGYGGSSDDEADALWLREAALQQYELDGRAMLPKTHLDALVKIQWPNLNGGTSS